MCSPPLAQQHTSKGLRANAVKEPSGRCHLSWILLQAMTAQIQFSLQDITEQKKAKTNLETLQLQLIQS